MKRKMFLALENMFWAIWSLLAAILCRVRFIRILVLYFFWYTLFVLCCILFTPFALSIRIFRNDGQREWKLIGKRNYEIKEYWQPQPLIEGKERSFGRARAQDIEPEISLQRQSSFFTKLPAEIRNMIYELVYEGNRLHIHQSYRRFGHVACRYPASHRCDGSSVYYGHPEVGQHPREGHMVCLFDQLVNTEEELPRRWSRLILWDSHRLKYEPIIRSVEHNVRRMTNTLALAKSCKLSCLEMLPVIYSSTVFAFTNISQFQLFSTTIKKEHLNAIRHLDVQTILHCRGIELKEEQSLFPDHSFQKTWEQGWETIVSMPNLKSLRVTIQAKVFPSPARLVIRPGIGGWSWSEEMILGPLRQVHHVPRFEVDVNWAATNFILGDVAFKLTRNY